MSLIIFGLCIVLFWKWVKVPVILFFIGSGIIFTGFIGCCYWLYRIWF